jgi:hypothetical protein
VRRETIVADQFDDPKGPIEHFSWGRFIIGGQEHSRNGEKTGVGKDIRLIGTKVSAWKERRGHLLDADMITGVYGHGIEALVIGAGADGMLEVPKDVKREIRSNGVDKVKVRRTPKACKLYNELYRSGVKVALLAHGTC